ncbi:MAG: hypothetical protein VYE29_04310 [Pseudomonadota bacterium]|nr:hypothetical protein [Pseudomonadota bacterium]
MTGLLQKLDAAILQLARAPDFSKPTRLQPVIDLARRVLQQPGGCAAIEKRAEALEEAGVFEGSDWAQPAILVPSLSGQSLRGSDATLLVIEALSELRMLAVAKSRYQHSSLSAVAAKHFLTQVLALNLPILFGSVGESERETQGRLALIPSLLLQHLASRIGFEHIIDELINEIWRILQQRPIQVDPVKQMITQISLCQANPDIDLGSSGQGANRLVSALFGPTQACHEDPGVEVYQQRLESMDTTALQYEATGFARAMHDTGLVSPYHAVLLKQVAQHGDQLLAEALGLSATGRDCLLCFRDLVHSIIDDCLFPETAQGIYGLALTLERGIFYQPPVAPALWRQLGLELAPWSKARLSAAFGEAVPHRARLMEGVLCMLGLPLGVGQGNNPTCQSARALSMWSYNDPDYLLQMVTWAARDDEIVMHFEGKSISSRESLSGVAQTLPLDLDPVSLLVVPHLDRIYAEMGRHCIGRDGDPHQWINPEFHGWWTGRGFRINVDVGTGHLHELESFYRHFYAHYHPGYNGNQPLIHPQPAGIAVTDSAARFIGWHAITIIRATVDPQGTTRVYFFNPNNDSGQDWGNGVKVSTAGHGERFGESSLSFAEFASRLYIFHYDPLEHGALADVSEQELNDVISMVESSWGASRRPEPGIQAALSN